MAKTSRYQNTPFFSAPSPFEGLRARAIGPAEGVIEHTVSQSDRLDALAHYYYVDSRKWWRILDANPDIIFAGDLSLEAYVGETIVIPRAAESGA